MSLFNLSNASAFVLLNLKPLSYLKPSTVRNQPQVLVRSTMEL
jgi:hypothetical protein